MQVNINDKDKILALWLTEKEDSVKSLPKDIEEKIEVYRQKKYRICMYCSGNEDIKTNLLNLILNNT